MQPASTREEEYLKFDDDMDRNSAIHVEKRRVSRDFEFEDEEEEPVLSNVFAVEQLKRGAATAMNFFTWGFESAKEQATVLSESEQVKKIVDTTKQQKEVLSNNAAQFWENTRPQREEISKSASSLSEKVQPQLERIRTESIRAFESISSTVNGASSSSRGDNV
jgi:gas vesicle protein